MVQAVGGGDRPAAHLTAPLPVTHSPQINHTNDNRVGGKITGGWNQLMLLKREINKNLVQLSWTTMNRILDQVRPETQNTDSVYVERMFDNI